LATPAVIRSYHAGIGQGQRQRLRLRSDRTASWWRLGESVLRSLPRSGFRADARIEEIVETADFSPRTPNTVRSAEDLWEELATIRDQGFAHETGEWRRGIFCVGAPILSEAVEVAGAVSVTAPDMDLDDEAFEEKLPEAVRRYANRIQIESDDAYGG
jgi:hypothetical protein